MQRVFATNVFGAMVVARESARHFINRKRGNIINISSSAGVRGFAGGTAYVGQQVRAVRHDRVLARRASQARHPRHADQPERSADRVLPRRRPHSERKLRAIEIAHAALSMLEMDDRGFITELSVWATNPD